MTVGSAVGAVLATLLLGAPAQAQRIRIAIHPLTAPGVDDSALVEELNEETQDILAGTGKITSVNPDDVTKELDASGGKCPSRADARVECLQGLALATHAEYALGIELKKFGRSYELSAVIAAANRVALQQPDAIPIAPADEETDELRIKTQLRHLLLDQMKLAAIPSSPVAAAAVPLEAPPRNLVPPSVITRSEETGNQQIAGPVIVAVGAAAVAGGVVALILASGDTARLHPDARGYLPPDQVESYQQAKTKQTVGGALLGAGIGTAAVGAFLWVFFRKESPVAVAVVPRNGGVGATLQGAF